MNSRWTIQEIDHHGSPYPDKTYPNVTNNDSIIELVFVVIHMVFGVKKIK